MEIKINVPGSHIIFKHHVGSPEHPSVIGWSELLYIELDYCSAYAECVTSSDGEKYLTINTKKQESVS